MSRAPSLRVIPWHLPYNRGKARKNLHSVCCTANIVVLVILRMCVRVCVCVTRGKIVVITFITNIITIVVTDQTVVIFYLYLILLNA